MSARQENGRMSPEAVAEMHEKARAIARARLGNTACNACAIADICSVKDIGECPEPSSTIEINNGRDVYSEKVSYKSALFDDSVGFVRADLRPRPVDRPPVNKTPKPEVSPSKIERKSISLREGVADKLAEMVIGMFIGTNRKPARLP